MVNSNKIRLKYSIIRFAPLILEENDFDNFFVANFYRPLTANAADAFEVMKEIEAAGKVPFTGIVNNSNLGAETEPEDVLSSLAYAREVSELSSLPLVLTSAEESVAAKLQGSIQDLFPMRLQKRPV